MEKRWQNVVLRCVSESTMEFLFPEPVFFRKVCFVGFDSMSHHEVACIHLDVRVFAGKKTSQELTPWDTEVIRKKNNVIELVGQVAHTQSSQAGSHTQLPRSVLTEYEITPLPLSF